MNSGTEKALGDGATALAITAGGTTTAGSFLGFLNGNAPAIGLLLTLVFGVFGIYFQWKRAKTSAQSEENKREIERLNEELRRLR